jgi:hypothetical protein
MNNPQEEATQLTGDYNGNTQLAINEVREILSIIDNLDEYLDQKEFWVKVLSILTEEK